MLLNYHIGRFVLGSLCVGDMVRLVVTVLQVSACNTDTNHTKSPTHSEPRTKRPMW